MLRQNSMVAGTCGSRRDVLTVDKDRMWKGGAVDYRPAMSLLPVTYSFQVGPTPESF